MELKLKYKYRLILDESVSFGSVGRTGRGLTELYNVPVRIIDCVYSDGLLIRLYRRHKSICLLGLSQMP